MRRSLLALLPAAAVVAALLPLAGTPAVAAPTCTDPASRALCGGRVVAEPEVSTSFHQFDGPFESALRSLEAIEARSPGFLEVGPISEFTKDPAHKSLGGRDLLVVRITDERLPQAGKKQVAGSLSVHGLESAGREGGLRYVEDLAIWTAALAAGGQDRMLYAGDVARPLSQVMRQTESWFGFTNPDGWAAGDLTSTSGPGFQRGNEEGRDLNRDYGTVGWYSRAGDRGIAESEPETTAWASLVRSFPDLVTSTDIHGELDTPNEAFADLIIPAGQWTPTRQQQVKQLGDHMIGTIERKFTEEGVVLDQVFGPLPNVDGSTPRRPANVAASYDIVGYDDSGFMGDWFSQTQDSVHMDVENFLSNLAPNNAYAPAVEQAHVAAVRGILESVVVEAMLTRDVRPALQARSFAYVADPNRTSSSDANGRGPGEQVRAGETAVPYDVSRLEYFEVLERTTGRAAVPVTAESIADGTVDLRGFSSLVVADMELPDGSAADPVRYAAALQAYTVAGGQLVLTDRALGLVDVVTGRTALATPTVNRTDAGHVDFVGALGDHPYEAGLVGKPSQTFYEVMLGFPSRASTPNYGFLRGTWESAGGSTVATVGPQGSTASPNTALGSLPLGSGRVTIFGALLPQAIEELVVGTTRTETPHPFGLADYAVTITGGQVLDNILAYDRPGSTPPAGVAPPPPAATTPGAGSSPSPSTSPQASSSPSPRASSSATPSPGSVPTAPAPACTTSAPVALSRSSILAGETVRLTVSGSPGSTVDLLAYTRPSTTYRVVRTAQVPATGSVALTDLRPPSSTRLFARERGCADGPSSVITVRSSLSLDARRTGSRTYRFEGNSLPKRQGGIPVAVYRITDDGQEVLTARTTTDARTGRWSLTRTFTGSGRFGFVVRSRTDLSNAAGASTPRRVTIR